MTRPLDVELWGGQHDGRVVRVDAAEPDPDGDAPAEVTVVDRQASLLHDTPRAVYARTGVVRHGAHVYRYAGDRA